MDVTVIPENDHVCDFNRDLIEQLSAQRKAGSGDLEIHCGIGERVLCHRAVLAYSCDLPSKPRSSQTREVVERFVDMCYEVNEVRLDPAELPAILEIANEFRLKDPLRKALEGFIGSRLSWFLLRPHLVQEIPESSIKRVEVDLRWTQLLFHWWDGQSERTKTYIATMKRIRATMPPVNEKHNNGITHMDDSNWNPSTSSNFTLHISHDSQEVDPIQVLD